MKKIAVVTMILLLTAMILGCTPEEVSQVENGDEQTPIDEVIEDPLQEEEEEVEEPLDEELDIVDYENKIYLSVRKTIEEITQTIDREYEKTTEEIGGYGYYTVLEYEGITFYFSHEEQEVPPNIQADEIKITSNEFSYEFNILIGNYAKDVINDLSTVFENAYDVHRDGDAFDLFYYTETGEGGSVIETHYILRLEYDPPGYFESMEEMDDNTKVKAISLFIPFN